MKEKGLFLSPSHLDELSSRPHWMPALSEAAGCFRICLSQKGRALGRQEKMQTHKIM